MFSLDTTASAHQVQVEALRRLGPVARLEQAIAMSDSAREIARAGIQRRHPEYSQDDRVRALVWLLHGEPVARAIWHDGARSP